MVPLLNLQSVPFLSPSIPPFLLSFSVVLSVPPRSHSTLCLRGLSGFFVYFLLRIHSSILLLPLFPSPFLFVFHLFFFSFSPLPPSLPPSHVTTSITLPYLHFFLLILHQTFLFPSLPIPSPPPSLPRLLSFRCSRSSSPLASFLSLLFLLFCSPLFSLSLFYLTVLHPLLRSYFLLSFSFHALLFPFFFYNRLSSISLSSFPFSSFWFNLIFLK